MKNSIKFSLLLIFTLTLTFEIQAQSSEWIRVQSNNGEFSIEVPSQYNFFYDKVGFSVSVDSTNYQVKEMNMLNAYKEATLLSVETYESQKDAIKAFYPFKKNKELTDFKLNTLTAKQYVEKNDNFYFKSLYFHTKKQIFVITAASRKGETAVMKHFFDSIIYNPNSKNQVKSEAISFSSLKVSMIDLQFPKEEETKIEKKNETPKIEKRKDESLNKFTIVTKPKAAFVDSARARNVQGLIRLKILFSQDGFIPKIEVIKSLPEGLLRQTIFAVIRIKFLPEEKDGVSQSVTKTIEYNFTLY